MKLLTEQNISHKPTSNSWSRNEDKKKMLEDYIRLCFVKDHPMYYKAMEDDRTKQLVWLIIDERVKKEEYSIYSIHNATASKSIQIYYSQYEEFQRFITEPIDNKFHDNYKIVKSDSNYNIDVLKRKKIITTMIPKDYKAKMYKEYFMDRQREVLVKEKIDPKYILFP